MKNTLTVTKKKFQQERSRRLYYEKGYIRVKLSKDVSAIFGPIMDTITKLNDNAPYPELEIDDGLDEGVNTPPSANQK